MGFFELFSAAPEIENTSLMDEKQFSKMMFFFTPWKQKELVCSSDVSIVCNNAALSQNFLNSSILLILVQVVLNSSENLVFYVNWANFWL